MKVIVYSTKLFEKELLAKANHKRHDITLISNSLSEETVFYSEGKDAVIVSKNDEVSAEIIYRLHLYGVKHIITRSVRTDHIDHIVATASGIRVTSIPSYSTHSIAEHITTLVLTLNRRIILATEQIRNYDFSLQGLIGFELHGKTLGLIGYNPIAENVAHIFNAFGTEVIAYDPNGKEFSSHVKRVELEELYQRSDIISLHLSKGSDNLHYINAENIMKMKTGMMLINASHGELVDTEAVLEALNSGKLGYYGADVYEYGDNLLFEDHHKDLFKDPLLQKLISHKNVIITPHQAFFTKESLQEITNQIIKSLDN